MPLCLFCLKKVFSHFVLLQLHGHVLWLCNREQAKCSPRLSEIWRYPTGSCVSGFLTSDQKQETELNQMCKNVQSWKKTPIQLQVCQQWFPCPFSFLNMQIELMEMDVIWKKKKKNPPRDWWCDFLTRVASFVNATKTLVNAFCFMKLQIVFYSHLSSVFSVYFPSPERSSMIIGTGNASGFHLTEIQQELKAIRTLTMTSIKRKVPFSVFFSFLPNDIRTRRCLPRSSCRSGQESYPH